MATNDGNPKFVILTPTFDETMGGAISMHLLCHRLNEAGETALLWPSRRPLFRLTAGPRRFAQAVRHILFRRSEPFSTGPFPNRLATKADLEGSIIVYPEIVSGNPLDAPHVVRWFLHRPGHLTKVTKYGPGELYFFILEAFNDPVINPSIDNKLSMVWFNEVYRDWGQEPREGACYMLRKGRDREVSDEHRSLVLLDPLSHEEKAAEFNRRRCFYSYDPYTMYSTYAAICGCIPITVPEPGKSKLDWHPREEDRYGMAYGEEDIPWAIATRGKLLARVSRWREDEDRMLEAFIRKCKDWYRNK